MPGTSEIRIERADGDRFRVDSRGVAGSVRKSIEVHLIVGDSGGNRPFAVTAGPRGDPAPGG